jgi:hypothetical protein
MCHFSGLNQLLVTLRKSRRDLGFAKRSEKSKIPAASCRLLTSAQIYHSQSPIALISADSGYLITCGLTGEHRIIVIVILMSFWTSEEFIPFLFREEVSYGGKWHDHPGIDVRSS